MNRTVDELLDTMSYPELCRWGLYYREEPFGHWRTDVMLAQICAILANVNRDPKQREKPFTIQDFMLFDKQTEPTEDEGAVIDPNLLAMLFAESRKNAE